jgi:hypothetical protein
MLPEGAPLERALAAARENITYNISSCVYHNIIYVYVYIYIYILYNGAMENTLSFQTCAKTNMGWDLTCAWPNKG